MHGRGDMSWSLMDSKEQILVEVATLDGMLCKYFHYRSVVGTPCTRTCQVCGAGSSFHGCFEGQHQLRFVFEGHKEGPGRTRAAIARPIRGCGMSFIATLNVSARCVILYNGAVFLRSNRLCLQYACGSIAGMYLDGCTVALALDNLVLKQYDRRFAFDVCGDSASDEDRLGCTRSSEVNLLQLQELYIFIVASASACYAPEHGGCRSRKRRLSRASGGIFCRIQGSGYNARYARKVW